MTPRRCFVRALWGDRLIPRSRTKILDDLLRAARYPHPAEPLRVFCFGHENRNWLRSAGFDPVLLSRLGIVNFFGASRRRAGPIVNWGCSMWRHKLVAIAAALEDHDEVVWLDWDCWPRQPLPANFWERLQAGHVVQGALRQYRRPRCGWRTDGRRLVPSGAFLYFRSRDAIQQILQVQALRPTWDDEISIAWWMDFLAGGWRGLAHHRAQRWEPFCYKISGQVWRPQIPLFTVG